MTYLCSVASDHRENYDLGVLSRTWGVEECYYTRIAGIQPGDELVFLAQSRIRSVHRIESKVYKDDTELWPPKDGDIFPYRIKISAPTHAGEIPSEVFAPNISFMRGKKWPGTIRGASGVFNPHVTAEDLAFIKAHLHPVVQPSNEDIPMAAEQPEVKSLFRLIGSDVLESLKRLLPSLGLKRHNGTDFPAEYDLGYGGNVILCRDIATDEFVVVDFNRGEVPQQTLIRILQCMSWTRQNLAQGKDVRGVILSESANQTLKDIVREVPNVSLRFYRIGIELLGASDAA